MFIVWLTTAVLESIYSFACSLGFLEAGHSVPRLPMCACGPHMPVACACAGTVAAHAGSCS